MYSRKSRTLKCDSSISWDLEITSAVLCNSYTGYPYGRLWCTVLVQTMPSAYVCTKSTVVKHQNTSVMSWAPSLLQQHGPACAVPKLNYQLSFTKALDQVWRVSLFVLRTYSGPAAWNKLPQDIQTSPTLNGFKWKLKT